MARHTVSVSHTSRYSRQSPATIIYVSCVAACMSSIQRGNLPVGFLHQLVTLLLELDYARRNRLAVHVPSYACLLTHPYTNVAP